MNNGLEGSGNFVVVTKADGSVEEYSFVSGLSLITDDVVRVITSSGAGFGDPRKRDPDAVKQDIENGLTTAERAREVHGM